MPIRVACPTCSTVLYAPDAAAGTAVTCSNCMNPMMLPAASYAPPTLSSIAHDRDDYAPRRRSRRDRDEDDEDDDRPRKKQGQSVPFGVIVGGSVLLCVGLIGVLVVIILITILGANARQNAKTPDALPPGNQPWPAEMPPSIPNVSTPLPEWPQGSPDNPGGGDATEMVGIPEPYLYIKWYTDGGRPVVGFDWRTGRWDNEDCLGNLSALFDRNQPDTGMQRVMARPGYAVGGLTVRWKKFVSGVRVTFMRQLPNGRLDTTDKYDTPWLGPYAVGTREKKLGGDGRAVIGYIDDKAGVLHAVALILDSK